MLFALQAAFALAVSAPQQGSLPPPAAQPGAEASDDIIVSALRIPRDKLPTGVYWDYQTAFTLRLRRQQADLYVRCAMNWASPAELRKVLDGLPGSAPMQVAQGTIILKGRSCQPGLVGLGYRDAVNSVAEYGHSTMDRSIIVERVLHRYGGDFHLSREETGSLDVQERHNLREQARNRLRLANDRAAFFVSSCLVREQPILATRLIKAEPGSLLEKGLLQALFVDGRPCLGRTKRITIDPAHFRAYVVDAYYRWLVAARNVASLVPADASPLSRADTQG